MSLPTSDWRGSHSITPWCGVATASTTPPANTPASSRVSHTSRHLQMSQANFNLGTVTLGNGFDNGYLADFGNYAVNRNYRLPYVQIWNLEVQQTLPLEIVLEAGYCGAKGTRLDVITAPGFYNNQAFPNAFFDFEDTGHSRALTRSLSAPTSACRMALPCRQPIPTPTPSMMLPRSMRARL